MALAIRNLALGYDRRPAVHQLDRDVPKGSLTAGVGPNGAGTSTLRGEAIRLACGVGQLRLSGPDLSAT
jgi:zinc/manganese transport system ATP-binding protein